MTHCKDKSNTDGAIFDVRRLPPYLVILAGMVLAFFVFLALDFVEQLLIPSATAITLRFLHLTRGFLATTGGMIFVLWIMRRKEAQLVKLRDSFSDELGLRTQELASVGRKLGAEMQRLDAVLSSMGEGVLEIDELGLIHSVNPRVEQILGIHGCDLIGLDARVLAEKFTNTDPRIDSPKLKDVIGSLDNLVSGEANFQQDNGTHIALAWTTAPLNSDGKRLGLVLTLADISERKRLEHALTLQREDFISALKHKLRTPVLANRRATGLLMEGAFGEISDKQQAILRLLVESDEKLSNLIDTLVEIYRYQNGIKRLNVRTHSVSSILCDVVDKFAGKAHEKLVELKTQPLSQDLQIDCDREAIMTLLSHLVENALEHTKSIVNVHAECNGAGDRIKLVIEDDGRGIAADDMPLLFERFYEVSAKGHHPASTGTGLCLCRQIAQAHGGMVSCDSVPGQGTSFVVVLPRHFSSSSKERQGELPKTN
ncbi:MAG: PAS domain-containing sensor histidine kinase [Candidatus Melainabacteria bacterium]|nr:PAS domain-containing sensor histidine kinase [Candidatus Melainabacteria bacterium]